MAEPGPRAQFEPQGSLGTIMEPNEVQHEVHEPQSEVQTQAEPVQPEPVTLASLQAPPCEYGYRRVRGKPDPVEYDRICHTHQRTITEYYALPGDCRYTWNWSRVHKDDITLLGWVELDDRFGPETGQEEDQDGELHWRYDLIEFEGEYYTGSWIDQNTRYCDGCDQRLRADDTAWTYGRNGNCESCSEYEDDDDDGSYLENYSSRAASHWTPEDATGLLMGIEVEVEARDDRREAVSDVYNLFPSEYVQCKRDGSLDDDLGIEIVTRPDSLEVHTRLWTGAIEDGLAKSVRGWKGSSTGTHVHVGSKDLTELQIAKIAVFLNHANNQELVQAIAGRSSTTWSQYIEKSYAEYKSKDRYEALNTETGLGTIEFRIFRSNLSLQGFLKNLQFVHALVSYCATGQCSATDVETADGFFSYVASRHLRYPQLAAWLELKGHIKLKTRKYKGMTESEGK